LGPSPCLPYAEILVPKRRARAEPRGISQKQFGERIKRSAGTHVGLDPKEPARWFAPEVMLRPFWEAAMRFRTSNTTTGGKSYKYQLVAIDKSICPGGSYGLRVADARPGFDGTKDYAAARKRRSHSPTTERAKGFLIQRERRSCRREHRSPAKVVRLSISESAARANRRLTD
jgi:hypothetical protein